jgi:Tfp pilus assembly protein PilW
MVITSRSMPLGDTEQHASRPAHPVRSLGCERGVTLVELLWYVVLSLFVIVGPLYFIVVSVRQQNVVSSRTTAARQAEAGLEQLVRDLRQAMTQDASGNALHVTVSNPTSTTTSIAFDIPTPGSATTPQSLTWTCPSSGATSAGTCTRTLGTGSAESEVIGVQFATFSPKSSSGTSMTLPATDPAYVDVALSVQATSQLDTGQSHTATGVSNPVTVQTGIDLRNFA